MAKKKDEVTPGVKVNFIAGEQLAAVEFDGLWQSSLERLLDGCKQSRCSRKARILVLARSTYEMSTTAMISARLIIASSVS